MSIKSSLVRKILDEEFAFEIPTSMIDVVFLLLVFFIVASQFKTSENRLDQRFPLKDGINFGDVSIAREYRIYVDGTDTARPLYLLDGMPVENASELAYKLKVIASTSPQVDIVIAGRRKTPFRFVVFALDACRQAGIDNIKFEGMPVEGLGSPARRS
ncbi:MAG TPA: biopolymer transporter ExbD [Planctomycetes bacterium]|nr:biopolymer transporter ExbD [Planctomycetota bacterium]